MTCCSTNQKALKPGQILILLAGSHRGKRVVFLKTLPSQLLLVTGPYKINGVPLRRVNRAYVQATSTCVDVSKVDVSTVADKDFASARSKMTRKESKTAAKTAVFKKKAERKVEVNATAVARQKKVDASILASIKDGMMVRYLRSRFSLSNGMYPHALKF